MQPPPTKSVSCPTCQKQVAWAPENNYRPFCSKRCKLIDFGEWATEKHIIPGAPLIEGEFNNEMPD